MKVFDVKNNISLTVENKEEMSSSMYIVTNREETEINQCLATGGKLLVVNGAIVTVDKPSEDYVWENDKWVFSKELKEARLEKEKSIVWDKIKDQRTKHGASGVKIVIDGVEKWFHTDEEALRNYVYNKMVRDLLANENTDIPWKTMDGSFVVMTKELLTQIVRAIYDKGQHDFKVAEMHRVKLYKSNNPLSYDFSEGWSEGFSGE